MNYWLVKSEPYEFSWDRLVKEKDSVWDGIRNYAARNNLRAMKKNDLVFFYHSNVGKEIVGIASVTKEAYQDPSDNEGKWSVINLAPVKSLNKSVPLNVIKSDKVLSDMKLIKISRLSVSPVTQIEWDRILELAETNL